MLEIDKAWLAGIIDSDGMLGIRKNGGPYLNLETTCKHTIEKFVNLIDQSEIVSTRKRNDNWRKTFSKTYATKKTISTLKEIYPYLVTKTIQANLLIETDEWSNKRKINTELKERKYNIYNQLKIVKSNMFDTPVRKIDINKDVDRAWLAGLIDGDGCIRINSRNNSNWITVSISSECIETLHRIHNQFNAGYIQIGQTKKYAIYNLYCKSAKKILECTQEYLVSKKDQATIALSVPTFENIETLSKLKRVIYE